tara:strand:- start:9627 stop:11957 length:2331 start_codon:yes stop_codon:yes gene_type:complete
MAMQPIKRYGGFTPTGVDTSGIKRMQALAGFAGDVLETTSRIGRTVAEAKAPAKAEAAVAKAREEGTEVEIKSSLAWGGNTYNQVAMKAYENGVNSDIKNALLDAQAANPDDVDAYNTIVQEKVKGYLQNVPEQVQLRSRQFFDQANASVTRDITTAAKAKADSQIAAGLITGAADAEDTISNLVRSGDLDAANEMRMQYIIDLENGVELGLLDAVKTQTRINNFEDTVAQQTVLGELDRTLLDPALSAPKRIANAVEFRDSVVAADQIPDLSAEQKETLVRTLDARIQDEQIAYTKERNTLTQDQMRQKADLKRNIDTGQISAEEAYTQIDQLFKDGLIKDENELIRYEGFVTSKTKAALKQQKNINSVNQVLQGQRPAEPLDQGAVDDYYESIQAALPEEPAVRAAYQAQVVQSTRYVPSMLKTELRNDLVSGEPERVAAATDTMERILDIPGMADEFSGQEVAFAEQVAFNMDYMDADKAIQAARTNTDPANIALVEARTKAIKDDKKKFSDAYAKEVDDAFMGFREDFQANPDAAAQMTSDYGQLVETYYKAGSSIESSKSRAMAALQANWTQSEFGLMKYAPEQYYGVGRNNSVSYIKKDIYDLVKPGYDERGLTFTEDDIFLKSDDDTARGASLGQPTYSILIKTSDGTLRRPMFIDDNGDLADRYIPDAALTESAQQAAVDVEKRKADKVLAESPDRPTAVQDAAKGTIFENIRLSPRKEGSMTLAEEIDVLGAAIDPYVYSPVEAVTDVTRAVKRKSDEYVESLNKDK